MRGEGDNRRGREDKREKPQEGESTKEAEGENMREESDNRRGREHSVLANFTHSHLFFNKSHKLIA